MIRAFALATTLLLTPAAALAYEGPAEEEETIQIIGPEVGATAPDFSAITSAGATANLSDISGENGAILVFSRSLDWCPFCKKQAIDIETIAGDVAADGWNLNLITYDTPEILAGFSAENELTYALLSDTDSAMITAFGLLNEEVPAGSRFHGVPHPAIIFIDAEGLIAGVQREEGYRERPPTEGIPQLVDLLNGAEMPADEEADAEADTE